MKLKKIVSLMVAISFLASSVSFAGTYDSSYKLAARPQIPELAQLPAGVVDGLGKLFQGVDALNDLGINDLPGLMTRMDELKQRGVIGFPRRNSSGKTAKYIFVKNGMFIRETKVNETVDDDFSGLIKFSGKTETIGDSKYELCIATTDNISAINAILQSINSSWQIEAFDKTKLRDGEQAVVGTETLERLHLFPKYIHDTIRVRLQTIETNPERIETILKKGVSYFDPTKPEGERIAIDEEALKTATVVLNEELQKNENTKAQREGRKSRSINIKIEDVRDVLRLHEKLHEIINQGKINVNQILGRMKKFCESEHGIEAVDGCLDGFLCSFARNYNYLPNANLLRLAKIDLTETQRLVLVEEMIVHGFIERYKFGQPVRVWNWDAKTGKTEVERSDIPLPVESIIVGQTAGVLARELNGTVAKSILLNASANGGTIFEQLIKKGYLVSEDGLVGRFNEKFEVIESWLKQNHPGDVERILPILRQSLNVTPDETADIFTGILRAGGKVEADIKVRRNYFRMLYGKHLDIVRVILVISKNFTPSCLLTSTARAQKMKAVGYGSDLVSDPVKKEQYIKRAKRVRVIRNPLDGGRGESVERDEYLIAMGRTEKDAKGRIKKGSKGGDMMVYQIPGTSGKNPSDHISIMEAKLLRAILEAERGDYAFVEYQLLGNEDSIKSFMEVLKTKRFNPETKKREEQTYGEYLKNRPNFKLSSDVPVQDGMQVPVIDRRTGCLTTEETGHGNHGLRAAIFLQDPTDGIVGPIQEGEDVIRVMYNGDGVNNDVDPVMVGWMAEGGEKYEDGIEEKFPIVMVTTTKTPIDKKGGILGIQIDETGEVVQIMEIAQAKEVQQEGLFFDMGLKGEGKGEQYFNTNTLLMNVSVLKPFLSELIKLITLDEFIKAMSPVLIKNTKGDFIQLEGAMSAVVLALAGYLRTTKRQDVKDLMKKHHFSELLRIVNIEEKYRAKFFTPFKESTDFWFLLKSGRYKFNPSTLELEDLYPEKQLPRFTLGNTFTADWKDYYKSVTNINEAFKEADITNLDLLEVPWRPVIFGDTILKGRVTVINMRKGDGKGNGVIVNMDDERIKSIILRKKEHIKKGISLSGGRLVLENVCIVIGDRDVFISGIKEEDGDINSGYFARLFYNIFEKEGGGHRVPGILSKIVYKTYKRMERDPLTKPLADLKNNREAKDYAKPTTEFRYPKYDAAGKPVPFDGVSIVCDVPKESGLGKLFEELRRCINGFKTETNAGYLAVNNIADLQFTICNMLSIGELSDKYEQQLNDKTRREVDELSKKMQDVGCPPELAKRRAAYTVVSTKVAQKLKEFKVWKNPRFKPSSITTFPTEGGRTTLALVLEPEGSGDLAIITKIRDIVREETGISDAYDFKKHITLGYFTGKFEDIQSYERFRDFIMKLNREVESWEEIGSIEFELFKLVCYENMENFKSLLAFGWRDANFNSESVRKGVESVASKIDVFVGDIKPQEILEPVAGPIGKPSGGEYAELVRIEVKDGKLSQGIDMNDAAKDHAKYGKVKRDMLDEVTKRLIDDKDYGPGILSVIDEIQIVDNIGASKGLNLLPYAEIGHKDNKTILYLDVDAFSNEEVLYVEMEHEISESIMKIVPYVSENIRELTTNYMSLKFALEKIEKGEMKLDELLTSLPELGIDMQFFFALKALVESDVKSTDDEKLIAAAIEHMRGMPYYRELFSGFPFADEWQNQTAGIQDAVERYKKAINMFNDIKEAKAIVNKVTETGKLVITVRKTLTGLRVDGLSSVSKGLAEMIGAVAKQVGNTDKFAGMLTKSSDKKYLLVSEDKLKQLKDAMGEKDFSQMKASLERNNFEFCYKVPEGVNAENVGNLMDPSDLQNMTDAEKVPGMFYMPMPYTRSAVYMTALIVQAKGDLSQIPLVKESIGELYKGLSYDDLIKLITAPWLILPNIQPVIAEMNNLRNAAALIEKAA